MREHASSVMQSFGADLTSPFISVVPDSLGEQVFPALCFGASLMEKQ